MKLTKVLLIHAAHHGADGRLVDAKKWIDKLTVANLAEMALPLLAAYTPDHIDVEKCEDYLEPVPWDTDAQVIGISAQVMQLSRALEIAAEFKRRGKIVVMGGYLPTMHPEAVQDHVDAICIGEGDLVWPRMLADIENDCLRKIYQNSEPVPIDRIPVPRYDLIKKKRLSHFVSYPVQATRGCPYKCEYCSIVQFYGYRYRHRPVQDVVRDIRATAGRYIHFTDDNLMENKKYAKDLFRAMADLNVIWGAQVTINVANDPQMLQLAYQAGCRMLAIGVESISQQNLDQVAKPFTKVAGFKQAFDTIQQSGIAVHALIVFGLPQDTRETFRQTRAFLEQCGISVAQFFLYTPYPKTPEGKRLHQAGRIFDNDLNHYRESYVVFQHDHMEAAEIQQHYWQTLKGFYSLGSIFKRIRRGGYRDKLLHLGMNLNYWAKVKRGIVPVYFGRGD